MSLDVLHARVAFRDRAFFDVMDLALRFVIVNGRLYAKVAAIVLLPCIVLTVAVGLTLGWVAGWIFAFILSLSAQVPFTLLASRLVFQYQVSARTVVRAALLDIPRVFAMRVMWTVMVTVGAVFAFVPGAWAGLVLLYVDEVMILERSRILPAFGRSQRLATGALGDAMLGVLMVVALPAVAILFADIGGRAFLAELLQFRAPTPFWETGGSVLAVLGWFGVIPYLTSARFFAYLNVRTRAEGWDIQTRFAAIAARADQREAA